jgi:hypothetical protein
MLSIHEINQLGKMVEDGKLGDLGLLRLAKSTLQGRKKGDTRSIP